MASTYLRDPPSVKEEQEDLSAVAERRPRPFRLLSLAGGRILRKRRELAVILWLAA